MFTEVKSGEPVRVVIVGAGHRALIYASLALSNPERMKVVGVAEPDKTRREHCIKLFNIPVENVFTSAEELAKAPRFADAVINGTMDHLHVETSIPLLRAGYHMLLEKPFAVNEEEMWRLADVAEETGRKVMICHVLRYAPFYSTIRQKIIDGEIGEIVATETTEHVSYHHIATAFVRGKWRSFESCKATMLLAKCCHDMDLITWLNSGNEPESVSSFGDNFTFRPEKAPEGAGKRCLADCPPEIEKNCPYSARRIYLGEDERWSFYTWEGLEDIENPTREQKGASLREDSLYGRCVYFCDNTNVDHQTVIVKFKNGATASHNMIGGTAQAQRSVHIIGTKGEIWGIDHKGKFALRKMNPDAKEGFDEEIIVISTAEDMSGIAGTHGGGDMRLADDFVSFVCGEEPSISCTTITDSINGHLCVYRAEESRLNGKTVKVARSR